ncbi:MAG: 8-oxo-dGTP diphosphatase [Lachnospiraceae bacterium]|nr:8-oxo-dGTP diphosphatase [Lachnospiraceae bacterium]
MRDTTLCYIIKDQKVLMLFRNKKENDLNEGKWVGPGGKTEPGETPEECMKREVFEETGLVVTKYRLHGIIKFISDKWEDENMYLFSATEFTGTLREECPEGELEWIPVDRVPDLPMWSGDIYFLKPLLSGEETINLTLRYKDDTLAEVIKGE